MAALAPMEAASLNGGNGTTHLCRWPRLAVRRLGYVRFALHLCQTCTRR